MIELTIKNLSLSQIADSGQCFRWKKIPGKNPETECYIIPAFGKILPVEQQGENFIFCCTMKDFQNTWKNYLDLENDYGGFINNIPGEDIYLKEAAARGSGIRILKQELFETIVSFIISQNNNISRIKNSIEFLSQKFGTENKDIETPGVRDFFGKEKLPVIYNFPQPESFSSYSNQELLEIFKTAGLGYRDTYLLNFVRLTEDNPEILKELKELSYGAAMEKLLEIKGIGPKVANCISLFSLHFLGACPIDTWIKKIIKNRYKGEKPHWINSQPEDCTFRPGGVYQQYVFNYERNLL